MDANEYLKAVRRHIDGSFSDVADRLGISRQAVSKLRQGGPISETTAVAIGQVLGIPGEKVYADIRAARAEDEATRKFWERIGKRVAAVVLAVAAAAPLAPIEGQPSAYYVKS